MSTWCKECGKTTFNEEICDHCGKVPREQKEYKVPPNKGARIIKSKATKQNTNKRLTECRTCRNQISKNAETCPHCGELSPLEAKSAIKNEIIKFIAILIGAFLIYQIVPKIMNYGIKNIMQQKTEKKK
jgi:ribosomal protein L32